MIPAWRRDRILQHLRERRAATIAELASAIGASESTARRDVEALAAQGALRRTPGGVIAPDVDLAAFEPSADEAEGVAAAEKAAIGRAAAARLEAGQCVVFDTGSTVREAARSAMATNLAFTAVTIDLQTALILSRGSRISVIVPGGELRAGSFSLLGAPGREFLRGLYPDLSLFGAHAISDGLVTETSIELAETKAMVLARSRRAAVLADASKFRAPAFRAVAPLSSFGELITDAGADPARLEEIRAAGVSVTLAERGE